MTSIPFAAHKFVQSIASRFDQICYSSEQPGCSIVYHDTQEIYSKDGLSRTTSRKIADQLHKMPRDIQVLIYNQAPCISQWFLITGFLDAPHPDLEIEKARWAAIELSAAQRLRDLGQRVNSSPSTQLLEYIFGRVISRANEDETAQISRQIDPFRVRLDAFSLKLKRSFYKTAAVVIPIVTNPLLNTLLVISVFKIFQRRMIAYLKHIAIPKVISFTIKHIPMPVVLLGRKMIQHVSAHIWPIALGCIATGLIARQLSPAGYAQITRKVFLLPFKMIINSSLRVALTNVRVQLLFGKSVSEAKDRSEACHYQDETIKAYQLWMDLMQNGVKKGMFEIPKIA